MDPQKFLKLNLQKALDNAKLHGQNILRAQGHNASGKLIETFETRLIDTGEKLTGSIWVQEYGLYQSTGVAANRINYNPFWLLPWAKIVLPNLSDKERISFVFAVWKKHKKEGMHTQESKRFSKTGERDSWIERMEEASAKDIQKILNIEGAFLIVIDQFIAEAAGAF